MLNIPRTFLIIGALLSLLVFEISCSPAKSTGVPTFSGPVLSNNVPTLTSSEVLAKFHERATSGEVQNLERLRAITNADNELQAMELVLFKLTTKELAEIDIHQSEQGNRFDWLLASSKASPPMGLAFMNALAPVAIKPRVAIDLGMFGWSVPREQFFVAQRALLQAKLPTNDVWIAQPRFHF